MTPLLAARKYLPTCQFDIFECLGWTIGFFVNWDAWWNGSMEGFGRLLTFEVSAGRKGLNLWLRFPVPRGGWDGHS